MLTIHLRLVSRLRTSKAIPPLPIYVFMEGIRTTVSEDWNLQHVCDSNLSRLSFSVTNTALLSMQGANRIPCQNFPAYTYLSYSAWLTLYGVTPSFSSAATRPLQKVGHRLHDCRHRIFVDEKME